MYKHAVASELNNLNNIVNNVLCSNDTIDNGIITFGNTLYKCAHAVFGLQKQTYSHDNRRNCKNPWFNNDCDTARREFNKANKMYRLNRSPHLSAVVINKRRCYRRVKRVSKQKFNLRKKSQLHDLSKQNPKQFWKEIKKIKKKTVNKHSVSAEDFYLHFNQLFSSDEVYKDEYIETVLNDNIVYDNIVNTLDCDFSESEVIKAINRLKRQKSPGEDMLIPELFIDSKDSLAPLLCKLFNYIYTKGVYPISWTKGIIIPVPKKGDLNNVDNYRGIMLTSVFSKIFSLLLDSRARSFVENNNSLSDLQFGFRNKRSTVDCIFVLQNIINKIIERDEGKLYCAFVDFKKAFDMVYRNGIWFKLLFQQNFRQNM